MAYKEGERVRFRTNGHGDLEGEIVAVRPVFSPQCRYLIEETGPDRRWNEPWPVNADEVICRVERN